MIGLRCRRTAQSKACQVVSEDRGGISELSSHVPSLQSSINQNFPSPQNHHPASKKDADSIGKKPKIVKKICSFSLIERVILSAGLWLMLELVPVARETFG